MIFGGKKSEGDDFILIQLELFCLLQPDQLKMHTLYVIKPLLSFSKDKRK